MSIVLDLALERDELGLETFALLDLQFEPLPGQFPGRLERRDLGFKGPRPVGLPLALERLQGFLLLLELTIGPREPGLGLRVFLLRVVEGGLETRKLLLIGRDRPFQQGDLLGIRGRPARPYSLRDAIRAHGHRGRCRRRCHGCGPSVHAQSRQRLQLSGRPGGRSVGGLAVCGRQGAGHEEDRQVACHNQPPFWMDETGRGVERSAAL